MREQNMFEMFEVGFDCTLDIVCNPCSSPPECAADLPSDEVVALADF